MKMRWVLSAACIGLTACSTTPSGIVAGGAVTEPLLTLPPVAAQADPSVWPSAATPDAITDAATEARIDALLARMTTAQKVGQLIQADFGSITPQQLAQYQLGSLLAGGNGGPDGNERASAQEWNAMVREFRQASLTPGPNGLAIPIIFGVDAVHGHNNIPHATIFPHNIGLGAARDPEMMERIGAATAAEMAGTGIEWTFAPTLAVPRDARWGRTYEGYSSDPAIVASYAGAMVRGLQGNLVSGQDLADGKIAATAKHFVADGGTLGGKDQGDAQISERDLAYVHGAGYPPAINAGAMAVMISFSSWNGAKHHGNKTLITDVLKGTLGFDGFVVGDWNGHGQVRGCTVTDCPQSINAGLDMFMAPDSWQGLYESTLRHAESGAIPQSRLDDAVRRILRVKFKLDLIDDPMRDRSNFDVVGSDEHLALAREAVAKSLVLLKNENGLLPIKPGSNVLVTGAGANDLAIQSGGWTISWQGTDVTPADFDNGRTIWQALDDSITAAGGTATLSVDGTVTGTPDMAVVVWGEKPYAEFQGDVPTLDYQPSDPRDLALLKRLKAQGIPVVSVFISGRPMFTNPEINASDAFVAAWLPGTQGDGVADVLVAQADGSPARDFHGTLPFEWPASAVAPITDPLFGLGYGLTYANGGNVPVLSEDPGIDLAATVNNSNFFSGGRARDPWVFSVEDAGGKRPVSGSAGESPAGNLTVRSVDVAAQEDGKALVWSGPAIAIVDGPPANMSGLYDAGQSIQIAMRIDAKGSGDAELVFHNGSVSMTPWLAAQQAGDFANFVVPLKCFAGSAAEMETVGAAMRLSADAGFAITLLDARIIDTPDGADCPSG